MGLGMAHSRPCLHFVCPGVTAWRHGDKLSELTCPQRQLSFSAPLPKANALKERNTTSWNWMSGFKKCWVFRYIPTTLIIITSGHWWPMSLSCRWPHVEIQQRISEAIPRELWVTCDQLFTAERLGVTEVFVKKAYKGHMRSFCPSQKLSFKE